MPAAGTPSVATTGRGAPCWQVGAPCWQVTVVVVVVVVVIMVVVVVVVAFFVGRWSVRSG